MTNPKEANFPSSFYLVEEAAAAAPEAAAVALAEVAAAAIVVVAVADLVEVAVAALELVEALGEFLKMPSLHFPEFGTI